MWFNNSDYGLRQNHKCGLEKNKWLWFKKKQVSGKNIGICTHEIQALFGIYWLCLYSLHMSLPPLTASHFPSSSSWHWTHSSEPRLVSPLRRVTPPYHLREGRILIDSFQGFFSLDVRGFFEWFRGLWKPYFDKF